MAPRRRANAASSIRIFGLKPSQHRTAKMQQILKYSEVKIGARASKERLLTALTKLQSQLATAEANGITHWLQSGSDSTADLESITERHRTAAAEARAKRKKAKAQLARKIKREPSEEKPILRECCVCAEELPEANFPDQKIMTTCNHEPTTCKDCLSQAIGVKIPECAWDQISCPECPETLSYDIVKTWASEEAFELYDKKSLLAAFRGIPGFTMCLAPGCGSGQIHEGGNEEPIMTCETCHFKTCFIHKMPWHTDQTCAKFDAVRKERMEQEAASEALIAEVAKICPNPQCGYAIVKISGCDHMTCRQCNYQFCFVCCANWTIIMRDGNEAHDINCRYHTSNINVPLDWNDPDDQIVDEDEIPVDDEEFDDEELIEALMGEVLDDERLD